MVSVAALQGSRSHSHGLRANGPRRALGVMLAAVLALLLGALPAGAHAQLESSDPADGAMLDAAPSAVSFTFGEPLLEQGNAVTITNTTTGDRLAVAAATVQGDTVSVTWPAGAGAGVFRAAFRVVSADGHPIEGSIAFTVAGGTSPTASSAPSATASVTPPAASAVPVAAEPVADPTPDDQGSVTAAWGLGIGLVVLLGAVAVVWSVRRSR